MRKINYVIMLLCFFIGSLNVYAANAVIKSPSFTSSSYKEVVYDIENFDISNAGNISISGWSYLHYHNNYGGRITAMALKVYDEGNAGKYMLFFNGNNTIFKSTDGLSSLNLTVNDTYYNYSYNRSGIINDFYTMQCQKGSSGCINDERGNFICKPEKIAAGDGSCIYRNLNFRLQINLEELENYFGDETTLKFRIVMFFNQLNDLITNRRAYDGDGDNHNLTEYAESNDIGVVNSTCKINGYDCTSGSQKVLNKFIVTVPTGAVHGLTVTSSRAAIRSYNATTNDTGSVPDVGGGPPSFFCAGDNTSPTVYTTGSYPVVKEYTDSSISNTSYSYQRVYDVKYNNTVLKNCTGSSRRLVRGASNWTEYNSSTYSSLGYVYASWVQPESFLSIKIKGIKVCNPVTQSNNLTCSSPGSSFGSFDDDGSCLQDFIVPDGVGRVRLKQHGNLDVSLTGRYVKSGQSFSINSEYIDDLSWEITNIELSTGANINNVRTALHEVIFQYVNQSELVKHSSASFNFNGISLDGNWVLQYYSSSGWKDYNASEAKGVFVSSSSATSGSIRLRRIYNLKNTYSNLNSYSSSGLQHVYSPSGTTIYDVYVDNGNVYFTDLDLRPGNYPINGTFLGLSGFSYSLASSTYSYPIWKANYVCSVDCVQGFYDYDEHTNKLNGYTFKYRSVDVSNPFPYLTSNFIADNWNNWINAIGTPGLEKVKNRFSYTNDLEYTVNIGSSSVGGDKVIKDIKSYNKNNDYLSRSFVEIGNTIYSRFYYEKLHNSGINGLSMRRGSVTSSPIGYCNVPIDYSLDRSMTSRRIMADSNCFCSVYALKSGRCTPDL